MTGPTLWKTLSDGGGDDVILAFDFPVTGRPEASFTDLVSRLDTTNLTIWEGITPSADVATSMTGDEYVDRWADELRASGRPIRALLGYCVGSVFVSAMAARISEWQDQAPQLIVFDPESPSVPTVYGNFYNATAMMGAALSKDEVEEAQAAGLVVAQESGNDIRAVGTGLATIFESSARIAFDRLGLDERLSDELSRTFASFSAYLIAADELDPAPGLATATAITSTGSSSGAGWAAREINFENVSHDDLLRDDDVAKAVSDALGVVSPAT